MRAQDQISIDRYPIPSAGCVNVVLLSRSKIFVFNESIELHESGQEAMNYLPILLSINKKIHRPFHSPRVNKQ